MRKYGILIVLTMVLAGCQPSEVQRTEGSVASVEREKPPGDAVADGVFGEYELERSEGPPPGRAGQAQACTSSYSFHFSEVEEWRWEREGSQLDVLPAVSGNWGVFKLETTEREGRVTDGEMTSYENLFGVPGPGVTAMNLGEVSLQRDGTQWRTTGGDQEIWSFPGLGLFFPSVPEDLDAGARATWEIEAHPRDLSVDVHLQGWRRLDDIVVAHLRVDPTSLTTLWIGGDVETLRFSADYLLGPNQQVLAAMVAIETHDAGSDETRSFTGQAHLTSSSCEGVSLPVLRVESPELDTHDRGEMRFTYWFQNVPETESEIVARVFRQHRRSFEGCFDLFEQSPFHHDGQGTLRLGVSAEGEVTESTLYRLELDQPVEPRPTHALVSCVESAINAVSFPPLHSAISIEMHFKFEHEQLQ